MRRKTTLGILFIVISITAWCQVSKDEKRLAVIEKARYLEGDLNTLLTSTTHNSKENFMNNIQGNVVLSFIVNKEGKMDSIVVESATEPSLGAIAFSSLSQAKGNKLSPEKVNNIPVDKKYLIVYRFRQFLNEQPVDLDYSNKAKHQLDKQKYDKALKICDSGIEENPFNAVLYELRSQVKENTGEMEGSKLDHIIALKLDKDVFTIVDIFAIGKTKTISTQTGSFRSF